MKTQIAPVRAVCDGNTVIGFNKAAIGEQVPWRLGGSGDIVAPDQLER
jgi:hypothetical protein